MSIRSQSTKGKVWKFVHHDDEYLVTTITGKSYEDPHGFLSLTPDGRIWINASCLRNGFAWDGCTPKWEFLDFTIGTPDGRLDYLTEKPITYYASMVHDALYQCKSEIPISRRTADKLFCMILKESGFMWWWLYHIVVRIGGFFFGKWKHKGGEEHLRIVECSWIRSAWEEVNQSKNKEVFEDHSFVRIAQSYVVAEEMISEMGETNQ